MFSFKVKCCESNRNQVPICGFNYLVPQIYIPSLSIGVSEDRVYPKTATLLEQWNCGFLKVFPICSNRPSWVYGIFIGLLKGSSIEIIYPPLVSASFGYLKWHIWVEKGTSKLQMQPYPTIGISWYIHGYPWNNSQSSETNGLSTLLSQIDHTSPHFFIGSVLTFYPLVD